MTVYEYSKTESDICRSVALDPAIPEKLRGTLLKRAEKWDTIGRKLTVKDGSKDVRSLDLSKLFNKT